MHPHDGPSHELESDERHVLVARGVPTAAVVALMAALAVGAALWFAQREPAEDAAAQPTTTSSAPASTVPLRSAAALRASFEAHGGFDGRTLGVADGAFDVVTFDPADPDRLLAAVRSSYGPVDNSATNEVWELRNGSVEQRLWAEDVAHDFVHFNRDGSTTVWADPTDDLDFGPRSATVHTSAGGSFSSEPLLASRFVAVDGAVAALTGDAEYYARFTSYDELVVETAAGRTTLSDGEPWQRLHVTSDRLLVAHGGVGQPTRVWDLDLATPVPQHALAGKPYAASSVSAELGLAVGVTHDGVVEVIDLADATVVTTLGTAQVDGVQDPLTFSADGSMVITVERDGLVSLRALHDGEVVAAIQGDAAQPRWVREDRATRSVSVVSPDGSRLALRRPATVDDGVTWQIIDLDFASA